MFAFYILNSSRVSTLDVPPTLPPSHPNIYLIPAAPSRGEQKPASQANMAAHIITEFALHVRSLNCVCVCICVCGLCTCTCDPFSKMHVLLHFHII